jgi:hypothetical protein
MEQFINMDKEAFEREAKQRMAFHLCSLQEFWRNLGRKNVPPGTLNSIISQTKAELNANWLSFTPQSLRDTVVRHRRLVLKSKSQLKTVQQPNKIILRAPVCCYLPVEKGANE